MVDLPIFPEIACLKSACMPHKCSMQSACHTRQQRVCIALQGTFHKHRKRDLLGHRTVTSWLVVGCVSDADWTSGMLACKAGCVNGHLIRPCCRPQQCMSATWVFSHGRRMLGCQLGLTESVRMLRQNACSCHARMRLTAFQCKHDQAEHMVDDQELVPIPCTVQMMSCWRSPWNAMPLLPCGMVCM